jgi:hypothetical protein
MILNFFKTYLKFVLAIFLLLMLHAGAFGIFITFMFFASIFYILKKQKKRRQQGLKQISAKTTLPPSSFSDLTIPKRYFNKRLKNPKEPASHEQARPN